MWQQQHTKHWSCSRVSCEMRHTKHWSCSRVSCEIRHTKHWSCSRVSCETANYGASRTYVYQVRNAVAQFIHDEQSKKLKSLEQDRRCRHRILQVAVDETDAEIWLPGDHGLHHLIQYIVEYILDCKVAWCITSIKQRVAVAFGS